MREKPLEHTEVNYKKKKKQSAALSTSDLIKTCLIYSIKTEQSLLYMLVDCNLSSVKIDFFFQVYGISDSQIGCCN